MIVPTNRDPVAVSEGFDGAINLAERSLEPLPLLVSSVMTVGHEGCLANAHSAAGGRANASAGVRCNTSLKGFLHQREIEASAQLIWPRTDESMPLYRGWR